MAVASLVGVSDLIASTFPFAQSPAAQARDRIAIQRLRLVGRLLPGDRVVMETPREERRGSGPGSPASTSLTAVALDANGRELSRTDLHAASTSRPTLIAELLPVTPEMKRVEVRRGDDTVYAFVRLAGRPELPRAKLRGDRLKWKYRHPEGAVPQLTVELVRRLGDVDVSAPFVSLDACGNSARLPLNRVHSADSMRLVASDGWNVVEFPIENSQIANEQTLMVRRLGNGGFWADVTHLAIAAWKVNGVAERTEAKQLLQTPILHLPPDLRGVIALAAGGKIDRRGLGDDNA